MADLEKTVSIIFEGVDQMGAGIDSATGRIDKFGRQAERMAAPMAKVTKAILAAEAAAIGMAVAFGTKAYNESVKFESAQADLAKTLGANDGSVDDYTARIIELSNTYGESATVLLQSMANYKQAGFDADAAMQLVKSGLDLTIAGNVEAAAASEYLVSILKGFKAPASDAAELLEVMNASSNTYATNVDELAKGMARLSPIASAMNLSFDETAELLIPVIEVFRSGPEAANALRTGLLKLGADTGPVTEALERLKVAQFDSNGVLRNSSDILLDVSKASADLEDSERLRIASMLFGIEQSAKMVEVMGALASGSIDVSEAMKTSTTVADEVAIRMATAEKAADRTSVAFNNFAATIGGQFRDELAGVVNGVGEIFRAFDQSASTGSMDVLFDTLRNNLGQIERLALEIAAALPEALAGADYSGFADGLDAIFGGLEGITVSVDDLSSIIASVGQGFKSLSEFSAGTIEVFAGLLKVIKPVIEAFTELDGDTQKLIGVIGGLSLVVGPVVGVIGGLTGAVKALAGSNGIIPLAAKNVPKLAGALSGAGPTALLGAAGAAVLALVKLYDELEQFNEFRFDLGDDLDEALEGTAGSQKKAVELALYNFDTLAGAYLSLSKFFGWGDEAADDFRTLSDAALDSALQVVGGLGDMTDAVRHNADGAASGVKQLSDAALAAAADVAGMGDNADGVERISDAALGAALAVGELADSSGELRDFGDKAKGAAADFVEFDGQLINVGKAINTMGGEARSAGKYVEKTTEQLHELDKQSRELASQERIAYFEFKADIKVAEIEADARRVESVFESLNMSIQSTGDTLGNLYGTLGGGDLSRLQELDLEKVLKQENDRRSEAFELQKRLTQAQIDQTKAKADAMRAGGGMINISSDGLEPALEMVMWQIIEKVQLQANAEGAEFLLGI